MPVYRTDIASLPVQFPPRSNTAHKIITFIYKHVNIIIIMLSSKTFPENFTESYFYSLYCYLITPTLWQTTYILNLWIKYTLALLQRYSVFLKTRRFMGSIPIRGGEIISFPFTSLWQARRWIPLSSNTCSKNLQNNIYQ